MFDCHGGWTRHDDWWGCQATGAERERDGLCCTGEKCWVVINKGNCWLKIVTEGQGKQKSCRSENKLGLGRGIVLMIFVTEIHIEISILNREVQCDRLGLN